MAPLVGPNYRPFRAKITLQHNQLRNLVVAPDSGWGNSIIYPDTDLLTSLDLDTGRREAITKTDVIPWCLNVLDDVIVCGSKKEASGVSSSGLVTVYNRRTQQVATHQIGDEINNAVVLYHSRQGPMEGMLCNNDFYLYFGQITGAGWRTTNAMDTSMPVNHAAISPDGNMMVLCGDRNTVFVHQRDSWGWKPTAEIDTRGDVGIAADYSPTGQMFAVAFQDGTCRIYDARKYNTPLHIVKSTRPAIPGTTTSAQRSGAFRAVKFSDSMHDLLFVSEEWGRIHSVDVRDFSNHDVLHLPPPSYKYDQKAPPASQPPIGECISEQDTRGLAWSSQGNGSLIVGSTNGIAVYNCPRRNVFPTFEFC